MTDSLDLGLHWPPSSTSGQPVLRTMVVCDLSDSTALVERLGDRRAAALLRKHDRLTRALIDEHGGREIDKTDGYLLLFERPTQAVSFALAYHRGLRYMSEAEEVSVTARVGIHVGDVVMWENTPEDISRGAKPVEVEGLAKPVAARLASLARPRQILLSGVAATIARRGQEEITEECPDAHWHDYGTYLIRGVAEPMEVAQIGEPEVADFTPPNNRAVARRILPFWRRPSTLSAAAVLLIALIGSVTWMILHQPPNIAFAARDWVVISAVENRTGQTDFNNTIDTALRVGLQQSRFVNVIAPQKMRQTLALMKKDVKTHVYRKLGAEIAVRDNARALIVPRISNYDNGFLIDTFVVDPRTMKVVTKLSVTANDEKEVVAAIDKLSIQLRSELGESLAQIKSTSTPLQMVMTSNLEALRAYSLANQARSKGDYNLSIDLLNHAINLDPNFASAFAMKGTDYIFLGRKEAARRAINKALANIKRLSTFERAKLHAQKVSITQPRTVATSAWKVVADLYPDDPIASNNTGLNYAAYLNDCASALPYLRHAASIPQPMRSISTYVMATCELSEGHSKAAIQNFLTAYENGFRGPFLALADAYVESRQYGKASNFLSGVPNDSGTTVSLAVRQSLVMVDQGDLPSAESNIRHALQTITPDMNESNGWALRLDLVGILWGQGKTHQARLLVHKDLQTLLALDDAGIDRIYFDYPTLLAAFARWGARLGDTTLAKKAIRRASRNDQLRGNPIRSQLVAIARAELALKDNRPEDAIHIAQAANSHPLWELLEFIARAKAKAGSPDAIDAFETAIDARPLAFGELYENELGICTRSIQWNLLILDEARYLNKHNRQAASREASLFLDHWREAPRTLPAVVSAREILQPNDVALPPHSQRLLDTTY